MKKSVQTLLLSFTILSNVLVAQTEQKWGLKFDSTQGHHVNIGAFHEDGVAYNKFFIEAWVYATGNSQYIYSAGYGGAHNILFGFASCVNGKSYVTGNIFYYPENATQLPGDKWGNLADFVKQPSYQIKQGNSRLVSNAMTATSFSSTDRVPCNKLVHVAAGYNGSFIGTWINGIPSSKIPYTGLRRTLYPFESVGYIGGSNHSNYNGYIHALRIFENQFPLLSSDQPFFPEKIFRTTLRDWNGNMITANYISAFHNKSLADLSSGLNGRIHSGHLANDYEQAGDFAFFGINQQERGVLPIWERIPADLPETIDVEPPYPNSLIFDGFSRESMNLSDSSTHGLGTTEIGSKVWQNSNKFGVLDGSALSTELYQTAFFETDLPAATSCVVIKQNSPKNDWYTFHFKVKNNGEKMGLTVAPSNIADPHLYLFVYTTPYAYTVTDLGIIGQNWRSICASWNNTNIQAGWDYGNVGGQNVIPANLVPYNGVGFSLSPGQRIENIRVNAK
jgi:hypothetical protein